MGLFDVFRSRPKEDPLQAEMKRLAPILFPRGHAQITEAGREISALLNNRVSAEAAGRIYASTKYLAHTAADKSKERIVAYIQRTSVGQVTAQEASLIYDRFIAPADAARTTAKKQAPGMAINADLSGQRYRLEGRTKTAEIDAMLFTVAILGARSAGWEGAPPRMFSEDGSALLSLSGSYVFEARPATMLARLLSDRMLGAAIDQEVKDAIQPLVDVASEGPFTLHATS